MSPVSEDVLCCHQDRCKVLIERDVCHLNKVYRWDFHIDILKPYLEDGDCVVADHVGPRKGLGKEKEHKKCHWKKDSPGRQCYGSEERSNIGKGKYPCKAENLGKSIVRCHTCQRS